MRLPSFSDSISALILIVLAATTTTTHALPISLESSAVVASNHESSTCRDGDLSKFIGYSGFKIQRHVVLRGMKPPLLHFVALSNCKEGELEYERLERTGRDTDIEWDKPMCFLGDKRITDDRGVLVSKPKRNKKMKKAMSKMVKFRNITIDNIPRKPHSRDPMNHNVRPPQVLEKRSMRDKFLSFLNKISKTKFIQYFQDSTTTSYEDLKPISFSDIDVEEVANMHCYKFARRKKYALRDLMIYAPLTWVGGFFECSVSDEEKKKYLASLKSSTPFSKPHDIQCSANNSVPLNPLIADDITAIQYEYDNGALSVVRTPYLYTPTSMDPRFGKPAEVLGGSYLKFFVNKESSDKLPYDNWFEEVDVNENYTYTPEDFSLISSVVNNATQILRSHIRANPLVWDWDTAGAFGEVEKERPHYLELKTLFSLTKMKDRARKLEFVKMLQRGWDDLKLSKESSKSRETTQKDGNEVH